MTAFKRVGHKGADLIAPGNTLASFDAALHAGVDMIEFDILPEHPDGRGRLLLAHDYGDAARPDVLTLEEGLAHLCAETFGAVELDVDVKLPGYEDRVVDALRSYGIVDRVLLSSQFTESLARVRAAEPRIRLGWSVPRANRDYTASVFTAVPALAALGFLRRVIPGRAAAAIRGGRCEALMAHWRLVTPRLVRTVRDAGGELYVWTVDEVERIRRLAALGVAGVITNDPRLFDGALEGAVRASASASPSA